VRKTKLNAG